MKASNHIITLILIVSFYSTTSADPHILPGTLRQGSEMYEMIDAVIEVSPAPDEEIEFSPGPSTPPTFDCNARPVSVTISRRVIRDCRPGRVGRVLIINVSSCAYGTFEIASCATKFRVNRPLSRSRRCILNQIDIFCGKRKGRSQVTCFRNLIRACNRGTLVYESVNYL